MALGVGADQSGPFSIGRGWNRPSLHTTVPVHCRTRLLWVFLGLWGDSAILLPVARSLGVIFRSIDGQGGSHGQILGMSRDGNGWSVEGLGVWHG